MKRTITYARVNSSMHLVCSDRRNSRHTVYGMAALEDDEAVY